MFKRLKPPLLDQTLEAGLWPVERLLQQGGGSGVEIERGLLRQHGSIPMPAEHQVGCPALHQIMRKVQQKNEIIQLGELHPTPLESH